MKRVQSHRRKTASGENQTSNAAFAEVSRTTWEPIYKPITSSVNSNTPATDLIHEYEGAVPRSWAAAAMSTAALLPTEILLRAFARSPALDQRATGSNARHFCITLFSGCTDS